jgi:glycosyltransferase involved in cell wall biosynthesis
MFQPLVSVIIPAYNAEKYIDSVFKNKFRYFFKK